MKIASIPDLKEFEFNGIKYPIEKFKNFVLIKRFRQTGLPIVAAHFEPLEKLITASSNEFIVDWEILITAVGSDLRIDKYLTPSLKIILESKGLTDVTDVSVDAGISDIEYAYAIVYAQIKAERILEHFIERKFTLINDIQKIVDVPIDLRGTVITKKLTDLLTRLKVVE